MKVLVTGGAGYIGSHLAGVLHRAGYKIRVLDLQSAGDEDRAVPGCDFIQGSVADYAPPFIPPSGGDDPPAHSAPHTPALFPPQRGG